MPAPRVRKSFEPAPAKNAPGSEQVLERIRLAEQGDYHASTDRFVVPDDAEAEVFDNPELMRAERRSERFKRKVLEKTPQKLKNPSDLQVRIRTGVVYIALTLVCILASEVSTAIYLAVLCAICTGELFYMLRSDAKLPNEAIGITASALFPLAMWLFGIPGVVVVLCGLMIVLLVWYVCWLRARVVDVAVSMFGAIYIGLAMSSAMLIRMAVPEIWGGVLLLGIFFTVWANDAFAYLVGTAIGKHPLAPAVSPKKSWEGFIAGLATSMGFWCLLTLIPGVSMPIPMALFFGFVCGIAGVLGDLVESRIKRNSGFKDSGTIMPGHGGLLDRCDSQFPVTLIAAVVLILGGCVPFVF